MNEYKIQGTSNTQSLYKYTIAGIAVVHLFAADAGAGEWKIKLETPSYNCNKYSSDITPSSFDEIRSIITGEYRQTHDPMEGMLAEQLNPMVEQLNHWVDSVSTPMKWITEGVQPPTFECKELTKSVVFSLLKNNKMYPSRVSATIEEGTFVNYFNHVTKVNLALEFYNDLDIAAIATRDKDILLAADIENDNFKEIVEIYNSGEIS